MPASRVPQIALPEDVANRLKAWHGLWRWSAAYHYIFGILGVAASSLAAVNFGPSYATNSKVLAAIAAVCLAVLGFDQPDRHYQKFVRAWRALDSVTLKYIVVTNLLPPRSRGL